MKISIRKKLTACLLLIIVFITLMYALVNNYGLEAYYRNKKIEELKTAYSKVDSLIKTENEFSVGSTLNEYSYQHNISIALIDTLSGKAIFSNERDGEYLYQRTKNLIFEEDEKNKKIMYQSSNYQIIIHHVDAMDTSFLELIGYASDNQTMIIMSSSIASLKNSVKIANAFLFYISIIALFLSSIFGFYLSSMITKPIKILAGISEKMGELDFTAKYEGNNKDEIGVLGNNMNIMSDTLKKAFDDLQKANEKLQEDIQRKEEIDRVRKDFIANVSHELKTPIALIQGYAEGLIEGLCNEEECRIYYTEVIIDEAKKMNTLVSQLLALSALEDGAKTIDLEEFNISELVQGVISATNILAKDKKININFTPLNINVKADEFKIEEVITNYLSNAITHVSENGYIDVKIEELSNKVRISVFNTGKNIEEDDARNIWNKFYKVDKAHSRTYGGSGIGLSIVKAIMEAHKNKYGLNNKETGVEFWFELDKA